MFKKKFKLSPIMTFILLVIGTILISGFLHLLNIQSEYSTVNTVTNELVNNVVEVKNMFSSIGIKHIVTTAVSEFVNFKPLATLIIVLIGIGVLEKTGFLKSFFTLLTRNSKKYTITFILVFMSLVFSLLGDIGFVIMLPIGALLFKYGHRNPLGGIITSFASLAFGYGINVFLSANDSLLLTMTLNAAKVVDVNYTIGIFFSLFIMLVTLIVTSFIFTNITEKKVMPILPRYENDEEELQITNKELRGLIIGGAAGLLFILIIIYMIVPGLPFSGALLDHDQTRYIEMLFGSDSLFSKGFIFIVTMLFVIVGLGYGLMTKTIKNTKDITDSLAYSLDGIGNILVLLFFASLFINVYNESNIGPVLTGFAATLISKLNFTGIILIITVFLIIAISNVFCSNSIIKWEIMSGSVIPLLMNASISPEFSQIIFVSAESATNGLTPLFMFYVIYIAFIEKYTKNETISLFGSAKYMVPYSVAMLVIWLVILIAWYLVGLPIGVGSFPGVIYGA